MKKVIFIILALGTIACAAENSEDSLSQSTYSSRDSEAVISSKTRPLNWAQKISGSPFNNLYKVNSEVYRSEKVNSAGYNYLQQKNVASILSIRTDQDNVSGTSFTGTLYHVPMNASNVTDAKIIQALKIIRTAPKPILVHCTAGADRTGVTMAMYRIVFQNWSKQDATKEMKEGGYHFHSQYTNLINYIRDVNVNYIKTQVFN